MKKLIKNLTLFLLLALTGNSYAIDINDSAQIHGFVSQGYLYSADNEYAGSKSGEGSFDFREIGINGFWEASPKLRFAGQVLSRKVGEASDGSLKVDFLLADYLIHSDDKSNFGVRIGRIKTPLGLYNAVRDIPSSRPGISVPNSIYFDSFRDALIATDGLNLYGSFSPEIGVFSWDMSVGKRDLEGPTIEYYMFGEPVEGKFKHVELQGLKLAFKPNVEHDLNFGLSFLHVNIPMEDAQSAAAAQTALFSTPSVGAAYGAVLLGGDPAILGAAIQTEMTANYTKYLTGSNIDSLYALFSVQYGHDDWLWTAEYLNIYNDIQIDILNPQSGGSTSNIARPVTEGFYLQGEWFATPSIHGMLRYEELYLVSDDRNGSDSSRPYDTYHGFGRGLTLGAKWLIDPYWTLSGQISHNEGTAWIPVYEGIEEVVLKKDWNTYALQLTYQF